MQIIWKTWQSHENHSKLQWNEPWKSEKKTWNIIEPPPMFKCHENPPGTSQKTKPRWLSWTGPWAHETLHSLEFHGFLMAKRREFSGMIHWLTINNHHSNPQQPIHSLRFAPVSGFLMGFLMGFPWFMYGWWDFSWDFSWDFPQLLTVKEKTWLAKSSMDNHPRNKDGLYITTRQLLSLPIYRMFCQRGLVFHSFFLVRTRQISLWKVYT